MSVYVLRDRDEQFEMGVGTREELRKRFPRLVNSEAYEIVPYSPPWDGPRRSKRKSSRKAKEKARGKMLSAISRKQNTKKGATAMAKRKTKKRGRKGVSGSRTYRAKSGNVYRLTKVASGLKGRARKVRRKARRARRRGRR